MMKKYILQVSAFFFALICLIGLSFTQVVAQSPNPITDAAAKARNNAKAAADRAAKDFREMSDRAELLMKNLAILLTSLVSYENPFSDFYDILRNQCQIDDITVLQQNMDNTGKALRRAALAGKESDFEALKKELINTTIELFYVRNFVDTKDGNYIVRPESYVYDSLPDFSDLGIISDSELRNLISQLTTKYDESGKKYKECDIFAGWKKVRDRVEKLYKALQSAGKELGSTLTDPVKNLAAGSGDNDKAKADGIKRSAKDIIGGYLAEHVSVNLPPVPTKLVEDTIKQTAKIVSGIAGAGQKKNMTELQKNISDNSYIFSVQTETGELRAKYDILYGEAGDNAINDVLKRIDGLNTTINNTVKKDLPPMMECLAQPNAKQCTGIK